MLKAQVGFTKKTFTTDNGLPNNFVQSITQDQTGFLWIATWDGLSRYDGYEFKNYYHKPEDSASVPFFVVDKAVVDGLNNVWVMCNDRPVVIFNRTTQHFDRFKTSDLKELVICDITIDRNNTVWMFSSGKNELYHYNSEKKQLSTIHLFDENQNASPVFPYYSQILIDNAGGIWFFSINNKKYEVFRGEFVDEFTIQLSPMNSLPILIEGIPSDYKPLAMYDINVSSSGEIWLFSKFGLYYFDRENKKFIEKHDLPNPNELTGKPFYYWSDNSGIHIIDTKLKETIDIEVEPGKEIETIFIDSQKNIWSGDINTTRENIGLNRYIKSSGYFKHYFADNESVDNLQKILAIKNRNDKWVGMRGFESLLKFSSDGTFQKVPLKFPSINKKFPSIKSFVQDSSGLWIGCAENYLVRYDFQSGKFTPHLLVSENVGNVDQDIRIHNIVNNKNGLFINGANAIYKFNIENSKLISEYSHIVSRPCFCMIGDGGDGFWIGLNSNTIKHLSSEFKELASIKIGTGENNVEHLCLGNNNDLWVALMGGGLGHVDIDSGKAEAFTTSNGLSNNTVLSILKDKNGNLWLSNYKGISRFDPRTQKFRNFGKTEGLFIEEFMSDANYLTPDGEMFFGGVGGMISFYPDSVDKYSYPGTNGKLLITEFKVSGSDRFFGKPVYELDSVKLQKGDNNFQLTFASLNFKNAEKIKYRYRLSGKNITWTETDFRQRNINYGNLKPGEYQLEIESTNNFEEWVSSIKILVQIPAYFYQTFWFKLTVILLLVFTISVIFILYNRQIRLIARQKQDELRLESLRGQMNPHFIFNSLNSINYFISNNDKISANSYIADFSRLIRSILSNMTSDYISFEKELESLKDYLKLEHLRFGDKFNFSIHYNMLENCETLYIFPGMVQPFIENSIWHGLRGLEHRKGFIRIEFIPVNRFKIKCIIEDDGIGRKMAQMYKNDFSGKKSRGIAIALERLKIISNNMKIEYQVSIEDLYPDKEESGTRVTIDLPIKQNNQ